MRKVVLTFGFISGAIMSGMMLATLPFLDTIGFDKGEVIGYTSMVVAFLLVYFGIRSYRDNELGGTISFGNAMKVGMLITLISCLCYVATWEVIYYKITPDFGDKYAAHTLEIAKAKGATAEQLEKQRKEMEDFKQMYKNPFMNAALTFVEPFPVGLIITIVCAGVLSRKRRAPGLVATSA